MYIFEQIGKGYKIKKKKDMRGELNLQTQLIFALFSGKEK